MLEVEEEVRQATELQMRTDRSHSRVSPLAGIVPIINVHLMASKLKCNHNRNPGSRGPSADAKLGTSHHHHHHRLRQ